MTSSTRGPRCDGQCPVRAWTDEFHRLAKDSSDPLELEGFATHPGVPLENAPEMYEAFLIKQDGCIKVILQP